MMLLFKRQQSLFKSLAVFLFFFAVISVIPVKSFANVFGYPDSSDYESSDNDNSDSSDSSSRVGDDPDNPPKFYRQSLHEEKGKKDEKGDSFLGTCKYEEEGAIESGISVPMGCDSKSSFQVRNVSCESAIGPVSFAATCISSGPELAASRCADPHMAPPATKKVNSKKTNGLSVKGTI